MRLDVREHIGTVQRGADPAMPVRNPPGVFLSGNSGHVNVPGEVPPGTLRVRSHAPGPLGSRPPPANS